MRLRRDRPDFAIPAKSGSGIRRVLADGQSNAPERGLHAQQLQGVPMKAEAGTLEESGALLNSPMGDAQQIVEIGILMERLEAKDPEAARMVDMHYFSGFTLEEIAGKTGLTQKQARYRWERGLKWLKKMLQPRAGDEACAQGRKSSSFAQM